jgi:hypothetical protein
MPLWSTIRTAVRTWAVTPLLFLSSYSPLFGLFAIRVEAWWLQLACVLIAVTGYLGLRWILKQGETRQVNTREFVEVEDAGPEASAYLAGYLLPFITTSNPSVRDAAMFLGFLLVAYFVHARSSLMQINPLLYIMQKQVLRVTDQFGHKRYLIASQSLSPRESISCSRLANNILLDRRPKKAKTETETETETP